MAAWTWTYRIVRCVVGLYFAYAGAIKVLALGEFARMISDYGILPEGVEMFAATVICAAELVAGVGLLVDVRGALAVIVTLLFVFIGVVGYGLWLGLDIECGCLGPGQNHSLEAALVTDGVLLLLCAYLYGCRFIIPVWPIDLRELATQAANRRGA